jgi:hypothetical protein
MPAFENLLSKLEFVIVRRLVNYHYFILRIVLREHDCNSPFHPRNIRRKPPHPSLGTSQFQKKIKTDEEPVADQTCRPTTLARDSHVPNRRGLYDLPCLVHFQEPLSVER